MHVAARRRSPFSVLEAVIRDQLRAPPPEVAHASLVTAYLNGRTRIYVTDPALIRQALVTHAGALAKGDDLLRAVGPALGQGLLTANGAHWRWQRGAAAPAFRPDHLQAFVPAMLAAAEATAARWGEAATLDMGHEMMRTTFAIIVETVLSGSTRMDVDRVGRGITAYLQATGWMFALGLLGAPRWTPFPGRRRAMRAARYLREAVTATVAERRAGADRRADLLDLLLDAADPETGRTMADGVIADNLLTFVTAGHETTAGALAWCLHLLARHPEQELRVRAEIASVTGGGPVQPEHIANLAYTRQVFLEALRLYPSVPIISRLVTEPFRLGTLDIAAGAYVYVPVHIVHRNPALWDRPDEFDPTRFSPEAERARDRCTFMPFGAGPRVCIGAGFATLEAVAILAVLLRAGRLTPLGDTPPPIMRLTMRPARPLRMAWAATAPA